MPSQQLVAEEFLLDPEGVSAAVLLTGRRWIYRRLKKDASKTIINSEDWTLTRLE